MFARAFDCTKYYSSAYLHQHYNIIMVSEMYAAEASDIKRTRANIVFNVNINFIMFVFDGTPPRRTAGSPVPIDGPQLARLPSLMFTIIYNFHIALVAVFFFLNIHPYYAYMISYDRCVRIT